AEPEPRGPRARRQTDLVAAARDGDHHVAVRLVDGPAHLGGIDTLVAKRGVEVRADPSGRGPRGEALAYDRGRAPHGQASAEHEPHLALGQVHAYERLETGREAIAVGARGHDGAVAKKRDAAPLVSLNEADERALLMCDLGEEELERDVAVGGDQRRC